MLESEVLESGILESEADEMLESEVPPAAPREPGSRPRPVRPQGRRSVTGRGGEVPCRSRLACWRISVY